METNKLNNDELRATNKLNNDELRALPKNKLFLFDRFD